MKKLSFNQIYLLTSGKKHWSQKKKHLIALAKNFGITINNDEELKFLIEVHCPAEELRIKRQYFLDSQSGKIKTTLTPTDVKGDFRKVDNPRINFRYHVSWAFSGAVFVLKAVVGDTCYLDNPVNKRKQLLTCKVSELRHIRKK